MRSLNNRQLLRFVSGGANTRPAINEATEAAARAVPEIDKVLRGVTRIKKLGLTSGRELILMLYVWAEREGMLDVVFPVEERT